MFICLFELIFILKFLKLKWIYTNEKKEKEKKKGREGELIEAECYANWLIEQKMVDWYVVIICDDDLFC